MLNLPLQIALSIVTITTVSESQGLAQSHNFEGGSLVLQTAQKDKNKSVLNRAVLPGYWDLGTSVRFSSPQTNSSTLTLPSIVRIGVNGRLSLTKNLEISGGFAMPPKREEVSDDPQLFDGVVVGRMAISDMQSFYALGMTKRLMQLAGPTDDGLWADIALGWNGQSFMDEDEHIAFSWHLGGSGGRAFYAAEAPWLAEADAGVGLGGAYLDQLFGFTAGADFHFPVLSGGGAYWMPDAPTINPQTRADLYGRMDINLATGWTISSILILGDRGQVENPETILPILEGGYDQTTFVLSFSYRGVRDTSDKNTNYVELDR